MKRRVIAILVAALLAVVGGVLLLLWVSKADERALSDQEPTDVYVATATIPSGTSLKDAESKGMLEQTQAPAKSVPDGALTSIDSDNEDLLALGDVNAGEILLDSRFGETPTGERAIEVPDGKVAVSVPMMFPARVGVFVTPGSHIVIYRQGKLVEPGESPRAKLLKDNDFFATSVLLGDVLVIGADETPLTAPDLPKKSAEDKAADAASGEQVKAPDQVYVVTVAVTPEQSLNLVHYAFQEQRNAGSRLYAALRSTNVDIDLEGKVSDLKPPKALP